MIRPEHCDLHTHTDYSDGRGTLVDNVRAAEAAGLDAIAIADHLFPPGDERFSDRERLRRRLEEVRQVRCWANTRVVMAVEATATDVCGGVSIGAQDLEGVELSLVDVGPATAGLAFGVPEGRDRQVDVVRRLYDRLAEQPLVDVLVHPFTLGRFGLDVTLEDIPDSWLQQLGERLSASEVAFEINNGVWWWWPQFQPLQVAESYARVVASLARGGARFVMGSDAHCNTGVGNLVWAQRVASLAGLGQEHWADVEALLMRRG